MTILNVQIDTTGQAGLLPRFIYIETTNTVAEVTAAGFLNSLVAQGIPLNEQMMALLSTKTTPNAKASAVSLFDISYSGGDWSLTPASSTMSLLNGYTFIGNAANIATAVLPSGDVTVTNTGVFSIAAGAIVNADVNASAAIAFSKLATLASGNILVGSAGGVPTSVSMSGDVNINSAGATTIQAGAVELSMLASGITPSHVVKFAGQHTTVGGAAAEAITVTGAAATDLAFVQMVNDGTANVTIVDAVVTLNTLTVTFSANPGNDAVINYQLLRAAT